MARAINTNTEYFNTVNQSAKTQSITLRRYCSTDNGAPLYLDDKMNSWDAYSTSPSPSSWGNLDTWIGTAPYTLWTNHGITCDCDTTYYWRAKGEWWDLTPDPDVLNETKYTNTPGRTFKTYCITPTSIPDPTLDNETSSSIRVAQSGLNFKPDTNETTAYLTLQYKRTVDSTWIDWGGTGGAGSGTGYSNVSVNVQTVTGLTASTSYDFRYKFTRPSATNAATYYSDTESSSTIADVPTVSTDAATSISHSGATLNATVDHNTKDGDLSWRYDTSDPGTPDDTSGTEVDYASNPVTGDGSYNVSIGSLTQNTQYWFWAIYEYDGGTKTYGSVLNFTTENNPQANAEQEDFMLPLQFDGHRGQDNDIYFTLRQKAATNNDAFYTGAAPTAAQVHILQDGGSYATATNAPSKPDGSNMPQLFKWTLDSTESDAVIIDVIITDGATNFRDLHLQIRTRQDLSQVHLDATDMTNATAWKAEGSGTGHGLEAVGGTDGMDINGVLGSMVAQYGTVAAVPTSTQVTLAATASAQADFYNGNVILITSGTGAGQARVITDYTTGKVATVDTAWTQDPTGAEYIILAGARPWNITPAIELGSVPTKDSSYGAMMQAVFQRFVYKITQTATVQTWFKENSTDSLGSRTVNDDGTTQTIAKLT